MEEDLGYKMSKNILIIAYKFPPMGGIGTRRWAKFAKYLARDGYRVHVLTIKYKYEANVNWYHDIENNENIIIHRINPGYPLWLMELSQNKYISFLQKALNLMLKRTFFYMDIAQNWAKYMLPKAKEIIKDNDINNVIVTSPPHTIAYYSSYLKIDLPHINLIQDFRDNWNDDTPYSYPNTFKFFYQKEKSAYMEWFVVNHSDYMVNVTQDITNRTKSKFQQYSEKFFTIYNGYDNDDIKNLTINTNKSDKIRIIYAGGLGLGRIEAIKLIMDVLLKYEYQKRKKIEINIYTSFNNSQLETKYQKLFDEKIVNFFPMVSPKKIIDIINNHKYCLSVNSPIYSYAFGTKIFDYMMLKKKIIHISNGGELSNILSENKQIVLEYDIQDINRAIELILECTDSLNLIEYQDFDIVNLISQYKKLLI